MPVASGPAAAAEDKQPAQRHAGTLATPRLLVHAGIAFHAAVVAVARNPVLADLFAEFTPVLRTGLAELLGLTGPRRQDPNTAADAHEAIWWAVAEGDEAAAAAMVTRELDDPFGPVPRGEAGVSPAARAV
ncbi:FCD domain-containing protein [Streptomyces cyaneogriseus]|uniref:FCD domain-containing protein n=1 Tax=Streptomyces cyaneogriseus TaxID=68192 RepID=UPI0023AF9797|nr:FCD domain-containing protein [Streptomyces cyaneogriseus]